VSPTNRRFQHPPALYRRWARPAGHPARNKRCPVRSSNGVDWNTPKRWRSDGCLLLCLSWRMVAAGGRCAQHQVGLRGAVWDIARAHTVGGGL